MHKMIRTFHPVGQDAFYTKEYSTNCEENPFVMVYDCGSTSKRVFLADAIDRFTRTHPIFNVILHTQTLKNPI